MAINYLAISAITALMGTTFEVANGIANTMKQYENENFGHANSKQRAALVCALAEKISHQLQSAGRGDFSVVITRGDLDKTFFYRRGGYFGTVKLGGYGYSIYAVANGYLKNNDKDSRGFHNWCVHGRSTQRDNEIWIK